MEKTNQNLLQKLTQILNVDKIISPEDIEAIRDALIGVLANNKKELENLTDETKQAVNSILDKVLTEHDTYLEKTQQIAQEAKSETTEAINSTLKSLEEVKALCKEVMECKPENGEDADEEYVIGEVLNRIKLPEYKEIVLDDGGAIVDKINSLPVNEENQIDAKHIKNLPVGKGGSISGGMTKTRVQQMIDASVGSGTPGGSDTQLQYNNAGAFGGISGATTDGTAVTYTANNLKAADITASGSGGFLIQSNSGTDVGLFGAGGGSGATFYGGVNIGGSLTVDTNTLYVDATNNRVGLGLTSPQSILHLNTGQGSTIFTEPQITLSYLTTDDYSHYIHTRHNNTAVGNWIDFYTSDGTQNGVYPTNARHGLTIGNQLVGIGGVTTPTHTLTLGSTGTGIALYNTADQTTNYERVRAFWSANVFTIDSQNGGTGTLRAFALQAASTNYIVMAGSNAKLDLINGLSTGFANIALLKPTATASSSVQNIFAITPTINQSTSAGYTVLLVNPTETTTGSGSKLLADFQVGGVSKFSVANTGIATHTNTTDTASNQVLVLQGDRATPTASDNIYQSYLLSNSSGTQKEVGRISAFIDTVTAGSENGRLRFGTSNSSGTLTNYVELTPSTWRPVSNDGAALGLSTVSWSDLFLASGGVINWNNGNATLTHSTGLLTSSVPIVAPKRVVTTTDDSTAVIDVALTDVYQLTAIANNTTFSFTGTPTDGQNFIIRYKDAGVSKTLTWTGFTAIGVTLPTATTAGKWGYVGVTYNSAASQYHVTAVTTEA